ncbi:MAG: RlmE family RNA methyltransferase [Hyphomicrobiales bacterium]|nr:RlmE family RNA methyltransferase [Hyphomicrobiales bacterium]
MNHSRKKVSASSSRWLQRDRRDAYVKAAAREGYRSRSAYKLVEINERFGFLRKGSKVVDLGAAPGGWSQVAAKRVGARKGLERVVAVDVLEMEPISGCRVLRAEFPAADLSAKVLEALDGRVNVVLSDMLANVSGNRLVDYQRSLELCRNVEAFASGGVLASGGTLCCKLLRGGDGADEKEMLADWRKRFDSITRFKPKASRGESAEIYLVASGFCGLP